MKIRKEFVRPGDVTYAVAKDGSKWFVLDDVDRVLGRKPRIGWDVPSKHRIDAELEGENGLFRSCTLIDEEYAAEIGYKPNNELQVFKHEQYGEIREITINGEPWFIAADVCRALDLDQVTNAVRRLDDDEQALISIKGISRGNDEVRIVSESGLYSLILGSRKPEAKPFKRWITHDVIPTIRKHGAYISDELLNDPDKLEAKAREIRAERAVALISSENERLKNRLFIRDHLKLIYDFINKCVRSYAGITYRGRIGYAWNEYYDELERNLNVDIRGRGKPYLKKLEDNEISMALKVASNMSIRELNVLFDLDTIALVDDVIRRVA